MANCPKCNAHLKMTDWRQHCPHCGANIVVYDLQERLMQQADVAEVQHYHFQKKIDRLKASFVGTKRAVVRIITAFVPIFALILPIVKGALNPSFGDYEGNVSLITIYNGVDTIGSDGFLTSDMMLTASLVILALSIIISLIHNTPSSLKFTIIIFLSPVQRLTKKIIDFFYSIFSKYMS